MIIGISGKRGVGKSLMAGYISAGWKFRKLSFADALKLSCMGDFNFTREHLWGNLKEAPFQGYAWTPRDYMIKKGQFMRYYDPDFWVNQWRKQYESGTNPDVVIDDLRYKNEAKYVTSRGGIIIRLNRYKTHNKLARIKRFETDESECQMDDYEHFDHEIKDVENRSKESLYTKVKFIMEDIGY